MRTTYDDLELTERKLDKLGTAADEVAARLARRLNQLPPGSLYRDLAACKRLLEEAPRL